MPIPEDQAPELEATSSPPVRRRNLRFIRVEADWRAALRESAIIILSVLAALAAQAWWQGRQDREREGDYLRQLLADTRENERRLDAAIAYDSAADAAGARVMAALLDRGAPPAADTFVAWVGRAVSTADFQPLAGSYQALLGTGDLHLIRTDSLRVLLSGYAATLENETIRQRDIRSAVQNRAGEFARALPFIRGVFTPGAAPGAVDVPGLRADRDAIAVIFILQAAGANARSGLGLLRDATRRLRHALEAEPTLRQ